MQSKNKLTASPSLPVEGYEQQDWSKKFGLSHLPLAEEKTKIAHLADAPGKHKKKHH